MRLQMLPENDAELPATTWIRLSHKRVGLGAGFAAVLVIAAAASGLGPVGYYFFRNKVLAHLHLCAPDDNIRVAGFRWWPRATALGLYLANPGGTVHIPPNYSETVSSPLVVNGNEVLVFDGPANLTLVGSARIIVIPPGSVIGWASGLVTITCTYASVDCMAYRMSPFNDRTQPNGTISFRAGTLKGFTLQGNSSATSGLHYGDVMGLHIEDVEIANFTTGPGLWADNIAGFTERYFLERISLDNNLVDWKLTNSSPGCNPNNTSHSYGRATSVNMRIWQGQIGIEVGPGAYPAHYDWWVVFNGLQTGKTVLQLDSPSGSCALPGKLNNGRLTVVGDDDGNGGTFVNVGAGAELGGECFLHAYNPNGTHMINTIKGSLACQTYIGASGNQIIFDQRTWPSSDVVLHFPTTTNDDTLATLGGNQTFTGNNLFGGPALFYNNFYGLNGHSLTLYSDNFTTPTVEITGSGSVYGKNFGIVGGGPGWSGTCPSGHSLVVLGGIVVGCN
jgi:hypothetical protein